MSAEDVEEINGAGLTGELSVHTAIGRFGSGKKSHITIIMQRPVGEVVELREPDATSIVYVQGDHAWRMFAPEAPTLKRTIRLEPAPYDPNWPGAYPETSVTVELSTGEAGIRSFLAHNWVGNDDQMTIATVLAIYYCLQPLSARRSVASGKDSPR